MGNWILDGDLKIESKKTDERLSITWSSEESNNFTPKSFIYLLLVKPLNDMWTLSACARDERARSLLKLKYKEFWWSEKQPKYETGNAAQTSDILKSLKWKMIHLRCWPENGRCWWWSRFWNHRQTKQTSFKSCYNNKYCYRCFLEPI